MLVYKGLISRSIIIQECANDDSVQMILKHLKAGDSKRVSTVSCLFNQYKNPCLINGKGISHEFKVKMN